MYIHSTLFWSKVVLVASDDAYVQDRHSRHLFKIIYLCERASIIYVNMRQSFLPLASFYYNINKEYLSPRPVGQVTWKDFLPDMNTYLPQISG